MNELILDQELAPLPAGHLLIGIKCSLCGERYKEGDRLTVTTLKGAGVISGSLAALHSACFQEMDDEEEMGVLDDENEMGN